MQHVMRVNNRFTYACSYPPSERIGSQLKSFTRRASKFPGDVRLLAAKRPPRRKTSMLLRAAGFEACGSSIGRCTLNLP